MNTRSPLVRVRPPRPPGAAGFTEAASKVRGLGGKGEGDTKAVGVGALHKGKTRAAEVCRFVGAAFIASLLQHVSLSIH